VALEPSFDLALVCRIEVRLELIRVWFMLFVVEYPSRLGNFKYSSEAPFTHDCHTTSCCFISGFPALSLRHYTLVDSWSVCAYTMYGNLVTCNGCLANASCHPLDRVGSAILSHDFEPPISITSSKNQISKGSRLWKKVSLVSWFYCTQTPLQRKTRLRRKRPIATTRN
jgi:hypothetical protein